MGQGAEELGVEIGIREFEVGDEWIGLNDLADGRHGRLARQVPVAKGEDLQAYWLLPDGLEDVVEVRVLESRDA